MLPAVQPPGEPPGAAVSPDQWPASAPADESASHGWRWFMCAAEQPACKLGVPAWWQLMLALLPEAAQAGALLLLLCPLAAVAQGQGHFSPPALCSRPWQPAHELHAPQHASGPAGHQPAAGPSQPQGRAADAPSGLPAPAPGGLTWLLLQPAGRQRQCCNNWVTGVAGMCRGLPSSDGTARGHASTLASKGSLQRAIRDTNRGGICCPMNRPVSGMETLDVAFDVRKFADMAQDLRQPQEGHHKPPGSVAHTCAS